MAMSTLVLGVGGTTHRPWSVGPRVIELLAGDPPDQRGDVCLRTVTTIPGELLDSTRRLDRLVVIEAVSDGGLPGMVRQTVLEAGAGSGPGAHTGIGILSLLAVTGLPRRVVIFSVEVGQPAPDEAAERPASPVADAAVAAVARMVRAELGRRASDSTPAAVGRR
jgi:Ni,Fe-hydrogenase maturation factor